MKESKNLSTPYSPIQLLKEEIDLRYKITMYKKLHKQFLYSCFEKHNFDLLYETVEDLIVE
jgi:hypothetical protein